MISIVELERTDVKNYAEKLMQMIEKNNIVCYLEKIFIRDNNPLLTASQRDFGLGDYHEYRILVEEIHIEKAQILLKGFNIYLA